MSKGSGHQLEEHELVKQEAGIREDQGDRRMHVNVGQWNANEGQWNANTMECEQSEGNAA